MKHCMKLVASVLLIAGCVGPRPAQVFHLRSAFDAQQAQALVSSGTNSIRGNAFMRQRGGGVVTCAGATVHLVPATDYARERFSYLYTMENGSGYNQTRHEVRFSPEAPDYERHTLKTRCDAQGNFAFDRVADGEFFVQLQISWTVGANLQGGNLAERVSTVGKPVQNIVMSR